jgi:hypothetical protein
MQESVGVMELSDFRMQIADFSEELSIKNL